MGVSLFDTPEAFGKQVKYRHLLAAAPGVLREDELVNESAVRTNLKTYFPLSINSLGRLP